MYSAEAKKLTDEFVGALETVVQMRAREILLKTLDTGKSAPQKTRPNQPRQLCPVPDCKKPAAPTFNMVCADHKDTSERKVAQYRKARRLSKKLGINVKVLLDDWEKYRRQAN